MVQLASLTLTEDEAWHVILYVRSFGKKSPPSLVIWYSMKNRLA